MNTAPGTPWRWDSAAELAVAVTRWIRSSGTMSATVNVNVPARAIGEIRGLRCATLDRFGYFRVAAAKPETIEFEVSSENTESEPRSDTALLRDGWATITALGPLVKDDGGLPDDLTEIWSPDGRLTCTTAIGPGRGEWNEKAGSIRAPIAALRAPLSALRCEQSHLSLECPNVG